MNIGIFSRNPDTAIQAIHSTHLIEQCEFLNEKSRCVSSTKTVITPSAFFKFMVDNDIAIVLIGDEITFDTSHEEFDEITFKKMIAQNYQVVWEGTRKPQVIPFG